MLRIAPLEQRCFAQFLTIRKKQIIVRVAGIEKQNQGQSHFFLKIIKLQFEEKRHTL